MNYHPAVNNALTLNYDCLQRLESITGGIYTKSYTCNITLVKAGLVEQ